MNTPALYRTLLLTITSFALLSVTVMTTASAANNTLDIDGRFKRLSMTKNRGVMNIDYKISKKSWRAMTTARIQPRLNISLPNIKKTRYVYAYSVALTKRKGQLILPKMNLRSHNTAEIRIVGYSGAYRVLTTSLGRAAGRKLRVPLTRINSQGNHGHGHGHNHGVVTKPPVKPSNWKSNAIRACKRNTKFQSSFNTCVKYAMALNSTDATLVVNACGSASKNSSGLINCLKTAKILSGQRDHTITSCGRVSKFDSGLMSCLKYASVYKYTAAPVVQACGKQTKFTSDLNACIKTSATLPSYYATRTVKACGKATSTGSGLKSCIIKSKTLGKTRLSIIDACGSSTRFDSGFSRCLDQSSGRTGRN